jgi:predicted Rossmann fold flavoprotein
VKIVVIGGGAAGFFGAITCSHTYPQAQVLLLEKTRQLLSKVRVSGGGRCNVTHACFDPARLVQQYPRGGEALRGPFTRFGPQDTVKWFEERGVPLKTEADGRMFPVSDSSSSIIECLVKKAEASHVCVQTGSEVLAINPLEKGFLLTLAEEQIACDKLLIATGSQGKMYEILQKLGHRIVSPVPSLFTFNIPGSALLEIPGISVSKVELQLENGLKQTGPLLLTHWGFSGPAVLKLSAFGARFLQEKNYQTNVLINWLPEESEQSLKEKLLHYKATYPGRTVLEHSPFPLPSNLSKKLVPFSHRFADLSHKQLQQLVEKLRRDCYPISGKTTFKEEFVTCGGVCLDEIHWKTMESRLHPGLHFAGEVLDVDGVTGGFNFQNAWTTSWIAAKGMGQN